MDEDDVEMIDPAEWWERVEDALPKELWEFVEGENDRAFRRIMELIGENRRLRNQSIGINASAKRKGRLA